MAFMRSTVVVWVRRLCGHASWGLRVGPSIVAKKCFMTLSLSMQIRKYKYKTCSYKIQIIGLEPLEGIATFALEF